MEIPNRNYAAVLLQTRCTPVHGPCTDRRASFFLLLGCTTLHYQWALLQTELKCPSKTRGPKTNWFGWKTFRSTVQCTSSTYGRAVYAIRVLRAAAYRYSNSGGPPLPWERPSQNPSATETPRRASSSLAKFYEYYQ